MLDALQAFNPALARSASSSAIQSQNSLPFRRSVSQRRGQSCPLLSMAALSIQSTSALTPPGSPGPIRSGSRTPKSVRQSPFSAAWPLDQKPAQQQQQQPAEGPCDVSIYKDGEGCWITRLSDMPIVELNAFIKQVQMSKKDAADLKKVRRARKNTVYTKRSRERRSRPAKHGRSVSPADDPAATDSG
jgi:hypothetical protein